MNGKALALLTMAILAVAVLPSAFAEEVQSAPAAPEVNAGVNAPVTTPKLVSALSVVKKTIRERIQEAPTAADKLRTLVEARRKIASAAQVSASDIRAYMREKFQVAIDRCKELNLTRTDCEEKLRRRVQLLEKLTARDAVRLTRIESRKLAIATKLANLKKDANLRHMELRDRVIRAREIASSKINAAKARFSRAVEKYNKAKNVLTKVRGDFVQTREKLKACAGQNTSECEELRLEIKEHAKNYTLRFLEMNLEQFDKLKSRIESAEDLDEETANTLLERIENKSAEIRELMDRISAVTNETSKEDIQKLIDEVKNVWHQDVKYVLTRTAGFLQTNRMGGVYVKLVHLEKRLDNTLAKLAERGLDTTAAESAVDTFNEKVEETRTHYTAAIDKFKEAAGLTGEERAAAIREAQSHMSEAKASLREAQQALRDAVKTIKDTGATEEDLEEDEADEVLDAGEDEIAAAEPA